MVKYPGSYPLPKKIWFHVDMDGLDAIYQCHGKIYSGEKDSFYITAIENSLNFFNQAGITATYFLIAKDCKNPDKRRAIKCIVNSGHNIACHGYYHHDLRRLSTNDKSKEIIIAKKEIEDTFGIHCQGFRAPNYSIDFDSLTLLRDAGYKYDASVFPNYEFQKRLSTKRLFREPFLIFPEDNFFEVPMPYLLPKLPPFHPCYIFYLRSLYFKFSVNMFKNDYNYITILFHLTDFATPQKLNQDFRLNFYTNNFFSKRAKLKLLRGLIKYVSRHFSFTTTENFLSEWPKSAPDLNPRTILGISTTHETGACVIRNGDILSAVNEERLSREKLDSRYPPVRSVREAIRIADILPEDIDAVAIAGLRGRDLILQTLESFWKDLNDFHAWNDYFPHFCRILYRLFYFWRATRYDTVIRFLKKEYGISPKVFYIEHHEAHASSVYRTGQPGKAFIITSDGVGDDISLTFSVGEKSFIRRIATFFYPNSFGQFYTACTQILGFKGGRHEGKITGLSGYGKADKELIRAVEQTLFLEDGNFRLNKRYYSEGFIRGFKLKQILQGQFTFDSLEYYNYKKPLKRLLSKYSREDIAYAFQHILEREMLRLAQYYHREDVSHLRLAGGVFANVKLNMVLSQNLLPESIYIFPNMGDGGLCIGAALSITGSNASSMQSMYLGTAYKVEELLNTLQKVPFMSYSKPTDMACIVAEELARGKVIARFDGRMEFGPRALGNRSILYHCGDRSVQDWLNRRLKRTEFMPFAPICIFEDAEDYFLVRDGEKYACEFMTLVVNCTEKMKQTCSAAVHIDGTTRPQLLRRETNSDMYNILINYKKLTGISCLINTSFNMHEEPIVRTPEEALITFQESKLDLLILGPFLVRQA